MREFIAGIGPEPSTFHFLHVQLPHLPWQYLEDGTGYPSGDPPLQAFAGEHGTWTTQRWLVEHAWQRHLLQTGYADRLVGELLDRLREVGIFDRALVVVAADHGIAFVPGVERREVQPSTVEQLAGVPLFVKAPGQRRGEVDDRPARTVDVLPTIADALGIELPFEVDGEALTGSPRRDAEAQVSVADRAGGEETLSFDDYLDRRAEVVAEKVALFGSGGWGELYRFGPGSELIGPPGARPGRTCEFTLADADLYEDVDPELARAARPWCGARSGVTSAPASRSRSRSTRRVAAVGRTYEIAGGDLRQRDRAARARFAAARTRSE